MSRKQLDSKKCSSCQQALPLQEFHRHRGNKDGHAYECKSCRRSRSLAFPEKPRASKRSYYLRNREEAIKRAREWRENNPERYKEHMEASKAKARTSDRIKLRSREAALRRKYGISLEQYDSLLERQGGCCAVCARHCKEFKLPLAVDHSHKTGQIRGLLCTACNYRLVSRHEDGDLLRRIADYIEQGTGWYVPPKPPKKRKRRGKSKPSSS